MRQPKEHNASRKLPLNPSKPTQTASDVATDDGLDDYIRRIYKIVIADDAGGYEDREDVRSVLKQLLASHHQAPIQEILDKLPKEWRLNIKTGAGNYKPSKTSSHPIEYWEGRNQALSEVKALLESYL